MNLPISEWFCVIVYFVHLQGYGFIITPRYF